MNEFLEAHPDTQYVDLLISDMNGVVRGKRIERASLHKVYEKGINLPASLFALDINGSTVESTGLGLDIGDADRICFPIPGTLSDEPWQKRPAQLLMTMHELDGAPFFADPREVLRQVVSKFDDLGLDICAAFELEFYLIDQDNLNGRPQPPRSPISGKRPHSTQVYLIDDLDEYADCLQDMLEGAKEQGLPADAIVKESAPAQFEVNLHHVADPIKACDYAILLKRLIKNIAYDHEMDTTFMAKPYPGQAGNGLHVHISLLDKKTGKNIFASDDPLESDALRHAVGGVLETMPASMAFLCPNINSYRRFGAQFYVPNAPSWGLDNRTVAVRAERQPRQRAYRAPRGRRRCQPVPDARRDPVRPPWPDQQGRAGRADRRQLLRAAGAEPAEQPARCPARAGRQRSAQPIHQPGLHRYLRGLQRERAGRVRSVDLRPRVQLVPAHGVSP
jgi:glutamine synthetase